MNENDSDEDIYSTRKKYRIHLDESFNILSYTKLNPFLQNGPQCGLVALAICTRNENNLKGIINEAITLNMTKKGEMFNAHHLSLLCKTFLDSYRVELFSGAFNSEKIIQFLKNEGIALVPYDADGNHSPCLKRGTKAHWAVINGIVEINGNIMMVSAIHGKSKNLALWYLDELSDSNSQLIEIDNERLNSEYILPEGGLDGPNGLNQRSILLHKLI